VRLPREVVFDLLLPGDPALEFAHLGVLAWALGCLENGRSSVERGYVEGDGADRVLVLPRGVGTAKFDPAGHSATPLLKHLAVNGLVSLEEQAGERRIGYGPRTRPAAS
jgi:hypothetical protein